MIFDTHAHYDDEQFNEDRVELLNSMEEQGVGTIVNVSAAYNSCRKVIALAKEYPFVYAAVGIHPDEVGSLNEETFAQMKELFKEEKVVAVGEIGLDYYWDNEPREVQKKWFIRQGAGSSGSDPQPGGSGRYHGDYERACERTKRCDPLLFLFQRNGTGIYQDGILYRRWRSGNVQECEEAERSSGKYSADINCTRDGLPVHGAGTKPWKTQQFCLYPLCGREDCGIKGHYV